MKHALVVGGTGMLANVSLWLIDHGYHVSVIARNPERMKKVINQASNRTYVTPLLADYTNGNELREKLKETIQINGAIAIVIAWIHSIAEGALEIITQEVSSNNEEWALFHVLGSSANVIEIKKKVAVPSNCIYHQVQLGFIIEGKRSRWLTHQEISNGVIEAMVKDKRNHTVGMIEPWEKRP